MRYFTKEWYDLMQEYGRTFGLEKAALRNRLDAAAAAFQRDLARQELPKGLFEKFNFHDGDILDVQIGEKYGDYVIKVSSPFAVYNKVTFQRAVVKQDSIPVGAVWLYEELYRHALGYEAHVLCDSSLGLRDTKIICADILFEEVF